MSLEQKPQAQIRFGTDGWRAVIAEDFTFANLERVAQAYASYLKDWTCENTDPILSNRLGDAHQPFVVIGYDRRFLSEQFAARTSEILEGNGFRVALFSESVPTPLVSWAAREERAVGGIVITASHNPPEFNGFKIKAPWGGSAAPETTKEVEKRVDAAPVERKILTGDATQSLNEKLENAVASYRQQIAAYVDLERVKRTQGSVIVDSMHGSGGRWVESFLKDGELKVETIRGERDPLFGGVAPEPIDRNLGPLKRSVVERGALIGLATDGDADRLGAVNERGETMTMHEIVPLLLLHLARERRMTGGVVRTFSQSVLTKRIADAHNLKLYETPIGFKYIAELMLAEDILIGAEESGGIGVKGHIPERDGILNCLLLLEALVTAGVSPSEMVRRMHKEFGEFYFRRCDIHMPVAQGIELVKALSSDSPATVNGEKVIGVETLDGTKLLFEDESWLLFRQSGTEPVLRIYSEATSIAKAEAFLDEGEKIASAALK
ncbi:MAG: phosphoglucomutase/phosphomannomutase family protein [Pyrinomonadaceae bacterium]